MKNKLKGTMKTQMNRREESRRERGARSASAQNVVVVGAGLSGLVAAWRIQQQGHEVSLLEKLEQPASRRASQWRDGFCLDASLPVLHSNDRRLLALAARLGVRESLLPLRPLQFTQITGNERRTIDPQRLLGVAAIRGVRPRDCCRLLRFGRLMARYRPLLDATAPERAADLDYRSVGDFARLYFGRSTLERWVSPEVCATFGADENELSRVTVLLGWLTNGTATSRPALHGVANRGLQGLIDALAKGLSIRFGVEATRIDEAPAGGFSVECQSGQGGCGMLSADAVVLATDAGEAARLAGATLAPAERDFLQGVEYAPTIALALALDRALGAMPEWVRVPHAEDLGIESLLLEPGAAGTRVPRGAGLITLEAGERFARAHTGAADAVVEKGLLADLGRVLPTVGSAVRAIRLSRHAAGRPRFQVGAYRALSRFRRVQRDRRELGRRLYYAADYLVGPRAEDAVVAGLRAARDLEDDLEAP